MYLKNIEVQGFKSFAQKINFEFHNGITGIVGPNGSGKSNVGDAVRWVLGEQSARSLRGGNMQDVIFSGTETRKPLGYASVAITLDNSDHKLPVDYEEVTVARKLYRSGESEYLINGRACRLKDVNELFYDTGIGKEGYSIIGQGQIDKILSGKPDERRELFDEAAGIVKFKRRKSMSVKKLEDERQNLVRVNDILSELEKQVGPLERQSEKAREYLKRKEELKTYDINMFLLEMERIRDQIRNLDEKLRITKGELEEATRKYADTKTEYESIEEQVEVIDDSIEKANRQLNETTILKQQLENQIALLKEQIHSARMNDEHFDQRAGVIDSEIDVREGQLKELHTEKDSIERQMEEKRSEEDKIKNELTELQEKIAQITGSVDEKKNHIMEILNNRASTKAQIQKFDTMMEQIQVRKSQINREILANDSEIAEENESLNKFQMELKVISDKIISLNDENKEYERRIRELQTKISKESQKLQIGQSAFHREQSRLESLKNITERYDGYGNSIKRVMDNRSHEKGLLGVVADIIKVEKKYETAIETALGGSIQNIVTDNEETAKHMIGFLKQNRLGRATFLPLTSITKPQEFKNPEALKEKGVIGMADELVGTEEEYRNVAKAMLGRIVVVDNVDNAVKIARKFDYGIRMVTLEGELLVPGGAISGGAFKNNSNLLGRRREMDELEKKVKKLSDDIKTYNQKIEGAKSKRNKLRMDLEALKTEMQRKSIEQNTARLNISQARERMEEEAESAQSLKLEEQEIETKIFEIRSSKETIVQELAASEELEKTTQEQILVFQKELEGCRLEESEASAHAGEWEVKVEKMRQALDYKQANVDRIGGELERAQAELNEILQALTENAQEVERKKNNILEIEKTIAASHENQDASKKKLDEDIAKKEELSAKQKGFFQSREEMSERMNALDKEVYRLSEQKKKLEDNIEGQINYMWDEYEITLSDAAGLRNEEMNDLPAMKREISGLKDEIRKLGNVNVNAIEDYRNLMERYTFMKTQHDDLVEAEKTLEGIIEELDTAMRKQFTEKFAEISREFDKVFKELFGGGKGTLELMEDEDILEAGIRIIAQPPGKKLQNMMQLSGGEKALSAISLLFAIQNLKPSPFCLLDEIEAALDDSNVGRFAKYLHKLTKNTQFIVITHRRGTMEQVDRLYGITMQEKGVSTLVSVNLIDKDLDD